MERHQIDERQAFEMLRDHARHSGRKLVHIARPCSTATCCFASTAGEAPGKAPPGEDGSKTVV